MVCEEREGILARIPHRPPFLFVDRVLERGERRILTEWRVPPEADFFAGHYPGNPILPGVIGSEFAFQSAALLLCESADAHAPRAAVPVLVRIQDARFRRIVRPGETIRAAVELEERLGNACHLRGDVRTPAGERVLSLRFVVALAAPEQGGAQQP